MTRDLWRRPGTFPESAIGLNAACILLAGVIVVLLGWPILYAVLEVIRGANSNSPVPPRAFFGPGTWMMLVRTIVAASAVSFAAVAIAYPIGWLLRSRRWLVPIAVLPMLTPSYVAYAGWGVLRAPQTILGNWLAQGTVEQSDSKVSWAYDIQAVLGLSLWAWPIAAIILATGAGRLNSDMLEALRLEATSQWRRRLELVFMMQPAIVWAFGVVFVLMLGSAVPFHVAQLETYAIALWRMVDLTAQADRWRVWIAALPLVAVTAGIGILLVRKSLSLSDETIDVNSPLGEHKGFRQDWSSVTYFGIVWVVAFVLPAALLATSLMNFSSITMFFRENSERIGDSLSTALASACLAWFISCLMWYVARRSRCGSIVARVCVAMSILIAPLPGLLTGLAISRAWNGIPALSFVADSSLIVVLAHAARFAFVPALIGWWLSHVENKALFDLGRIDGSETILGWLKGCYFSNPWPPIAGAVAVGLLSFQEIEASIMVVPPGYGSMSQWMLQQLHYLRQDSLASGVLFMLIPVMLVALLGALLISNGQRRKKKAVVSSSSGT